jgi:hypothetical protein
MSLHASSGLDGDSPFFLSFFLWRVYCKPWINGALHGPAGQAVIAMLTLQGRILVFPMLGYFRETSAIQALLSLKMRAPQNLDQFIIFLHLFPYFL